MQVGGHALSRSSGNAFPTPAAAAKRALAKYTISAELAGVDQGFICCDRYSGNKRFARLNPGVVLAFCWANVRRDFLDLVNSYPQSAKWALQWAALIGQLYRLSGIRMKACMGSPERASTQHDLERALQQMATQCAAGVANHELLPAAAKVLQSMMSFWSG